MPGAIVMQKGIARARRGITFFEITIGILIIGLLAAIASPRWTRSARVRNVQDAAIQVASHIQFIRSVAINEGRPTSLTVDPGGDRFFSADVDFPERVGKRIDLDLKNAFDPSIEVSGDFDGAQTLLFDLEGVPTVRGRPLSSGTLTIHTEEVAYQIQVDAGTGMPVIADVTGQILDVQAKSDVSHGVDGTSDATEDGSW